MSVEHCFRCDRDYDTDYFAECPPCELFECDACGEMKPDCETIFIPAMGDYTKCQDCADGKPIRVREAADPDPTRASKVLCLSWWTLRALRREDPIGFRMGTRSQNIP